MHIQALRGAVTVGALNLGVGEFRSPKVREQGVWTLYVGSAGNRIQMQPLEWLQWGSGAHHQHGCPMLMSLAPTPSRPETAWVALCCGEYPRGRDRERAEGDCTHWGRGTQVR